MLVRSTTLGTSLALLAVCLQLAVAAIGGRICLRMAPLPASDGCVSWCCDEDEASTGDSWAELDGQPSLGCPANADCCLEIATDYFATGIAGLKHLDASALALPAPGPGPGQVEIAIRRVRADGPGAAQPPPSMPMIRSTVLRL